MECIVCRNQMNYDFSKYFNQHSLGNVDYWRCVSCGFVASKTHFDLSDEGWGKINREFHASFQGTDYCPDDRQWVLRLNKQAEVIADLTKLGILPADLPWVDFGCGDGKLSDMLYEKYKLKLLKFDRFMKGEGYISEDNLKHTRFGFAITTSVFEHLRDRKHLDEIASLVADNGVMGIHTLVAEEVPHTPDWFYLLPVHCAFYTNKSMQILFDQWGYSASIYHVDSRLWFWFKETNDRLEEIIVSLNSQPGRDNFFYHYKRGFMDYWKLNEEEVLQRIDKLKK